MPKPKHIFVLLYFMILGFALASCHHGNKEKQRNTPSTQTSELKPQHRILYGINIDSLNITTDKVKRNQFLADLLLPRGVSYATIDYLAKHTRKVFDVRRMRHGHTYAILFAKDSLPKPLYFVYEISASNYVVYQLQDTLKARLGQKPVIRKDKNAKGIIKSSLWMTITDQGDDPNLAIKLSEIYAWTIDFFELRKGDEYKIIYPQLYIDGKYVGFDEPKAANFIHKGVNNYAFYFEQNGRGDYFDENGKSLERTFLKAPLKYRRISSRFSNHRWHPVLKIYRPHHGVDYAAAEGTPVHSIGDGVVIKRGYQKNGAGNYLRIRHNGTYTTQYAHLRYYARGMRVGVKVHQGQLIGYVGHTGLATGPHLDFRVYKFGQPINPLNLKSPPAKPIAKVYQPAFDSLVRHYKPLLDSL